MGLRPRLLGALLLTSIVTLAVAALALLSPLEQRLRQDGESTVITALNAAHTEFSEVTREQRTGQLDEEGLRDEPLQTERDLRRCPNLVQRPWRECGLPLGMHVAELAARARAQGDGFVSKAQRTDFEARAGKPQRSAASRTLQEAITAEAHEAQSGGEERRAGADVEPELCRRPHEWPKAADRTRQENEGEVDRSHGRGRTHGSRR